MFKALSDNKNLQSWALTFLRIIVGLVLLYHGYPKLFGDDATRAGLTQFFSSTVLPAPATMVWVAGLLECVGGLLLIVGAYTGIAANVLIIEFLVIILFVKLKMGWKTMELDALMLSGLIILTTFGSGAFGFESLMGKKESDSVPVQPGMTK